MFYLSIENLDFGKAFDDFQIFLSPRVFKIEDQSFCQSIANKKKQGVLPNILDQFRHYKKVTAILKLKIHLSLKGLVRTF